jgi:hypothetical protein
MPKIPPAARGSAEPVELEADIPRCNIARTLRVKQRVVTLLRNHVGNELRGHLFSNFVRDLHRALPKGRLSIASDVLEESLQGLVTQKLTRSLLSSTVWRLVANIDQLRCGHAVPKWSRQVAASEWSPMQLIKATLRWTRRGKPGADFSMQFMGGSQCPLVVRQFWSSGLCAVLATDMGFTRPWNERPYVDPRQLFGLRFFGKVERELCGDLPGFSEIRVTGSMRDYNRRLLELRLRDPLVYSCPHGFHQDHPCHQCPVGVEDCALAVHQRTFIQRRCSRCNKEEAWFDPGSQRRICVDCFHFLRRKGEL